MSWRLLETDQQLNELVVESTKKRVLIFKHSTRCSISSIAKMRLDQDLISNNENCYYLDLIAYRDISNKIAERFDVHHESPQVLIIDNDECIFDESHLDIQVEEIENILNESS